MTIVVYTVPGCKNCGALKDYIKMRGVAFEEKDMSSSESVAELMSNGVFALSAPVLQIGNVFFDMKDIFPDMRNPRKISDKVSDAIRSEM